jgi:iron complex outermembrane receptor protein
MAVTKQRLLATTVFMSLALVTPQVVMAQDSQGAGSEQQDTQDGSTEVDEVVITGSRIRRSTFSSTQPIQVITAEESTLEGLVDPTEILQGSTAAATAGQINNYFTGFVTTGGPGVNTISLRGLGAQRTLVLINGRRAGPAGARGTVGPTDLNTIPGSLIERTEVLTDGASSIYGSDAVAGVINIITTQNRDGGNINVYTSQPTDEGGEEYQISGSYGWRNDRGYISVGADYYERKPLFVEDRDFFACPQQVNFRDSELLIRADVVDPATGDFKCQTVTAGLFTLRGGVYGAGGTDFAPDASAVAGGGPIGCDLNGYRQVRAFSIGTGPCALGNNRGPDILRQYFARTPTDSPLYRTRTAVSPVTRTSITAFAGYDLTPDIEVFGELLLNRRESNQDSFRQLFPGLVGSLGVPSSAPRNPFGATYDFTIIAPSNAEQQVDYARGVAGVRGTLNVGRGFDWELAYQYSRSEAEYGATFIYRDRFAASLGTDGCNEALLQTATACPTNGVDYFSTAAINGQLSAVDREFLLGYAVGNTEYIHQYLEGVISGELFDLPAGPVGAALGFQIRKEEIDDTPSDFEANGFFAGSTAAQRTAGSDEIREAFLEIEVPVIRNQPLFNELTVNLSGRFSDYESYGSNSTYKVGFNWGLTPEWRLRGSLGTSFRAPALYEQFLGNQTSFLPQATIDPCRNRQNSTNQTLLANCLAAGVPLDYGAGSSLSATIITGGGRDVLDPETAETHSLGLIWTPSFIDLNVALDYFRIQIENQVAQFGSANIVNGCYLSNEFANEPLCQLFVRAPNNDPTRPNEVLTVNNSFINISNQVNEGLDLTARYQREFSFGDLLLSTRASYILEWDTQLRTASVPTQLVDQIGNPVWVANATAQFDRNDWTFTWNVDFIAESSNDRFFASNTGTYFTEPVFFQRTVEDIFYHAVSVRKRMDDWSVIVGVRNLFNEYPGPTSTSGGARGAANIPLTSQYDYVGRRVFFNISREF